MEPETNLSPERVILRILHLVRHRVGKPIHRTHLVKMVYLCDYVHSQSAGSTLTGLRYTRDHFGPNALGNQIVKRADVLEDAGLITIEEKQNKGGSYKFLYQATDAVPDAPLAGLAEIVVSDVVEKYGAANWRKAVEAAKATPPYQTAELNHVLIFPALSERHQRVRTEIDQREAEGRYNKPRRGTGLTELKARYGLGR